MTKSLNSVLVVVVCWSLTSLCHSNGHIETNSVLLKQLPLSETNVSGKPCVENINRNFTIVAADVAFET